MSEVARLLRYLVQGDKEAKVTAVTTYGDPNQFTTQLSSGQTRKRITLYNRTDPGSGEVLYGFSDSMTTYDGIPVPSGEIAGIDIPIADEVKSDDAIKLYFMNSNSGELGSIFVREIA